MAMSTAIGSATPVGRRSASRRVARKVVTAELAATCDVCGGKIEGGQVLVAGWTYCSLECAQSARDRTPPGHYFG